jgi:hypothetical protein
LGLETPNLSGAKGWEVRAAAGVGKNWEDTIFIWYKITLRAITD